MEKVFLGRIPCGPVVLALCAVLGALVPACSLNGSAESSITLSVQDRGARIAGGSSYIGVYEENSLRVFNGPIAAEGGTATITLDGYPTGPAKFLIALAPDPNSFYVGYAVPVLRVGENTVPVSLSPAANNQKLRIPIIDGEMFGAADYDGTVTLEVTAAGGERFSLYVVNVSYTFESYTDSGAPMDTWSDSATDWFVCDNQNAGSRSFPIEFKGIRRTNKVAINRISVTEWTEGGSGKTYRAQYTTAPAAGSEALIWQSNPTAIYTCTVD